MAAVLRGSRYLVGRCSKHVDFVCGKRNKLRPCTPVHTSRWFLQEPRLSAEVSRWLKKTLVSVKMLEEQKFACCGFASLAVAPGAGLHRSHVFKLCLFLKWLRTNSHYVSTALCLTAVLLYPLCPGSLCNGCHPAPCKNMVGDFWNWSSSSFWGVQFK